MSNRNGRARNKSQDPPKGQKTQEIKKRSNTRSPEKKDAKKQNDSTRNRDQSKQSNKPSRSTDNSKKSPNAYNKFARNTQQPADETNVKQRGNVTKNASQNNTKFGGREIQKSTAPNNRFLAQQYRGRNAGQNNKNQRKKDELGPDFKGRKIRIFKNGDFEDNGSLVGIQDGKCKTMEELLTFLNEKIKLPHDVTVKKLYTTIGIQITNPDKLKDEGQYVAASKIFTPGTYVKKKKEENEKEKKDADQSKYGSRVQNGRQIYRQNVPKPTREGTSPDAKTKGPARRGFAGRRARSASPPRNQPMNKQQQNAANRSRVKPAPADKGRPNSDSKFPKKRPNSNPPPAQKAERKARDQQQKPRESPANQRQPITKRRVSDSEAKRNKTPPRAERGKPSQQANKPKKTAQAEKVEPPQLKKPVQTKRRETYRVDPADGLREPVKARHKVSESSSEEHSFKATRNYTTPDKQKPPGKPKPGTASSRIPVRKLSQEKRISKSPSPPRSNRSNSRSSSRSRSSGRRGSTESERSKNQGSRNSSRSRGLDGSSGSRSEPDITEAQEREGGMVYDINFDSERALIHDTSSGRSSPGSDREHKIEREEIDHGSVTYSSPGDPQRRSPSPAEHWEHERSQKNSATPSPKSSKHSKEPDDQNFFGRKSVDERRRSSRKK